MNAKDRVAKPSGGAPFKGTMGGGAKGAPSSKGTQGGGSPSPGSCKGAQGMGKGGGRY